MYARFSGCPVRQLFSYLLPCRSVNLKVLDFIRHNAKSFHVALLLLMLLSGLPAQVAHLSGAQSTVVSGLSYPAGVAADSSGNVYVADGQNNRVLKETLSGGNYTQSIVASSTSGGLSYLSGVAVDVSGNVYISDEGNNRVLKETLSGGTYTQSTVASSISGGLNSPEGGAVDSSGNVYVVDTKNNRVVKETLSGGIYIQSTVASSTSGGLSYPSGVAVDSSGNVYISDQADNGRVLKETLSGGTYTQSTVASGAFGASGALLEPNGIAVDSSGNVYIAGYGGSVVKETLSGGSYTQSFIGSGLSSSSGVALDGSGNVYVADISSVLKETLSGGNFGTVNVGSASSSVVTMIFAIDTAFTLSSAEVVTQGSQTSDFTNAGTGSCTAGHSYNAGATCTVDVTFAPKFAGSRYGAAVLLTGTEYGNVTGSILGSGLAPQVNFVPGTLSVESSLVSSPRGVAVDGSDNVYVVNTGNNTVSGSQSIIPSTGLDFPYGIWPARSFAPVRLLV